MLARWRRDERLNRHCFGIFAVPHMREVNGLRWGALRLCLCYSGMPQGWQRYDVRFSWYTENPPVAAYAGLRLTSKPDDPLWKLLYTEHVQMA